MLLWLELFKFPLPQADHHHDQHHDQQERQGLVTAGTAGTVVTAVIEVTVVTEAVTTVAVIMEEVIIEGNLSYDYNLII